MLRLFLYINNIFLQTRRILDLGVPMQTHITHIIAAALMRGSEERILEMK